MNRRRTSEFGCWSQPWPGKEARVRDTVLCLRRQSPCLWSHHWRHRLKSRPRHQSRNHENKKKQHQAYTPSFKKWRNPLYQKQYSTKAEVLKAIDNERTGLQQKKRQAAKALCKGEKKIAKSPGRGNVEHCWQRREAKEAHGGHPRNLTIIYQGRASISAPVPKLTILPRSEVQTHQQNQLAAQLKKGPSCATIVERPARSMSKLVT